MKELPKKPNRAKVLSEQKPSESEKQKILVKEKMNSESERSYIVLINKWPKQELILQLPRYFHKFTKIYDLFLIKND